MILTRLAVLRIALYRGIESLLSQIYSRSTPIYIHGIPPFICVDLTYRVISINLIQIMFCIFDCDALPIPVSR